MYQDNLLLKIERDYTLIPVLSKEKKIKSVVDKLKQKEVLENLSKELKDSEDYKEVERILQSATNEADPSSKEQRRKKIREKKMKEGGSLDVPEVKIEGNQEETVLDVKSVLSLETANKGDRDRVNNRRERSQGSSNRGNRQTKTVNSFNASKVDGEVNGDIVIEETRNQQRKLKPIKINKKSKNWDETPDKLNENNDI